MPEIINWAMLREPYNWITVALMLAIATFGLCLVMSQGDTFQHLTGSAGFTGE